MWLLALYTRGVLIGFPLYTYLVTIFLLYTCGVNEQSVGSPVLVGDRP
jgi:hypothetical protein